MDVGSSFETKFCLISINTPEWNQLVSRPSFNNYFDHLEASTKEMFKFNFGKIMGVCLPSSCDTQRVLQIINKRILIPFGLNATSQKFCSTKASDKPFALSEMISVLVFLVLSNFLKH